MEHDQCKACVDVTLLPFHRGGGGGEGGGKYTATRRLVGWVTVFLSKKGWLCLIMHSLRSGLLETFQLTLHTLTSVCIFSTLFSIHFLWF